MSFAVGSLVRARGREWVVLPESDDDLLVLRPLGGTDDEIAGHPHRARDGRAGDLRACPTRPTSATSARARLLRDALRLGFRSSAGPFRSLRPHRRRAAPVPARAAADGAQARPGAPADRRRRRHRQDHRGAARSPASCSTRARSSGSPCSARRTSPSSGRPRCATSSTSTPSSSSPARPPGSSAASASASRSSSATRSRSSRPTTSSPTGGATTSSAPAPSSSSSTRRTPAPTRARAAAAATSATSSSRGSPPTQSRHLILVTATPHSRQGGGVPRAASASSTRRSASCPTTSRPTSERASAAGSPATSCSAAAATSSTTSARHAVPRARGARGDLRRSPPSTGRSSTKVLAYARETVADPATGARTASASAGGRRSASCARSPPARPPRPRRSAAAPHGWPTATRRGGRRDRPPRPSST